MPSKTCCPFIIYDFETGGIDANKNPVVEVGMVSIDGADLQEIARFEARAKYQYNQDLVYEDRAMSIHGVTVEDLMDGMPINDFVGGIIDLITKTHKHTKGHFQKPILVGHNIQDFDNDFFFSLSPHTDALHARGSVLGMFACPSVCLSCLAGPTTLVGL